MRRIIDNRWGRGETGRRWRPAAPPALLAHLIAVADDGLNTLRKPADA